MTSTDESVDHSQDLKSGDLSVTALYTAQTWAWAQFKGAEAFTSDQTRVVFKVTNGALALMRLFRWGLPRLPEGLAQRHLLIDQLAEEREPDVILELAAGLSSRALRLSESLSSSLERYLEVDLPHVIDFKSSCYQDQSAQPSILQLHAHNLKELDSHTLESWLEHTTQRVIIAEGIMMYLSADEAQSLLELIGDILSSYGGRLIFDWVPTVEQPRPGLFGRILGALMRMFTGGQDFERDERTREDLLNTLDLMGAHAQAYDTQMVASSRGLPFVNAKTQQLIFCADWSTPSNIGSI